MTQIQNLVDLKFRGVSILGKNKHTWEDMEYLRTPNS